MKKIRLAAIIMAVCMLLGACGGSGDKSTETTAKTTNSDVEDGTTGPETVHITVALDWTPNTNHTGLYVAQQMGYFDAEGLSVDIVQPSEDGATMMTASGQAQFGIDFQDYLAASFTSETPVPVTAVAAILQHNTSGLVSEKSKGIDSFAKLPGHNYATWENPIEQAIMKYCVEKEGGDFSEVELIPEYVTDVVSAIQANIDTVWIYYAWDGIATELAKLDTNFIYFKDINPVFDYYSPVIIANNDFIQNDPLDTEKFLKAVKKGYEYAAEHPEEAAEMLLKAAPELDEELVKASQKWISKEYISDAKYFGYIDPARWNAFYNWLNDENLVPKKIEENTGFTNEFLSE